MNLWLTRNKLTNNLAGFITTGLGPAVARGPPVACYSKAQWQLKPPTSKFYSSSLFPQTVFMGLIWLSYKLKLSHYTPRRRLGVKEV
jgi:hypothetical protein